MINVLPSLVADCSRSLYHCPETLDELGLGKSPSAKNQAMVICLREILYAHFRISQLPSTYAWQMTESGWEQKK